jgi:hypothetical protein
MPFEEYASGGPPVILPFAEYAIVSADGMFVDVSLLRVPLDKSKLLKEVKSVDNPICRSLEVTYSL